MNTNEIPQNVRDAHAAYKAGLTEYSEWLGTLSPIRPLAVVDGWDRQADLSSKYAEVVTARQENYLDVVWQESKGDAVVAMKWIVELQAN